VSLLTELLDRLSGVSAVREKLGEAASRLDRLSDLALDHERRLTRVETLVLGKGTRGHLLPREK
jgi:hypothetical protein